MLASVIHWTLDTTQSLQRGYQYEQCCDNVFSSNSSGLFIQL